MDGLCENGALFVLFVVEDFVLFRELETLPASLVLSPRGAGAPSRAVLDDERELAVDLDRNARPDSDANDLVDFAPLSETPRPRGSADIDEEARAM